MKTLNLSVSLIVFLLVLQPLQTHSQNSCTACSTANCAKVSFVVTYQGKNIYSNDNIPWVQGMNVTVAMNNANSVGPALSFLTTQFCPYGSFVSSINGLAEKNSNYWALYINGVYAKYGIDFQKVNAGDKISFVYTSFEKLNSDGKQKNNVSEASVRSTKKTKKTAVSHQTLFFTNEEN